MGSYYRGTYLEGTLPLRYGCCEARKARNMDKKGQIVERAEALRDSVGKMLKNRLTYPKTIITLLRDGKLGEDHVAKMVDGIHESIKVVDAKFIEFIEELKSL
jgi:hypothetical protein